MQFFVSKILKANYYCRKFWGSNKNFRDAGFYRRTETGSTEIS